MCAGRAIQPLRIRMVTARPAAPTRDSHSERPLPADSGEPASMPAASSLCYPYGMHASRRQQQACVGKAAAGGICARCHGNRCDLIEVTAPSGFRLPLVAVIWVCPASPLTRGRRDVRGRLREQLSSHTSRGSASLRHRCAVCTIADWARAWPATHAASCSAADSRRTASAGSGCIGSIMRAPSHAID